MVQPPYTPRHFVVTSATGQTPNSYGKPTEKVVVRYEKLVESGAFLTPEGWKMAAKLCTESRSFPPQGEMSLMDTGGAVGEDWVRDGKAEVGTMWTDYYGTTDSTLRYWRPHRPPSLDGPITMTPYVFRLAYTNKHREIGENGETLTEVTGPWEWKIEDPRMTRWTTVDQAIAYVAAMHDKTDDPAVKKNADKTIATWKRLRPCGNASAC